MITPHDKKTGRHSKKEGIGKMKHERKESKRIIEKVPPKKKNHTHLFVLVGVTMVNQHGNQVMMGGCAV